MLSDPSMHSIWPQTIHRYNSPCWHHARWIRALYLAKRPPNTHFSSHRFVTSALWMIQMWYIDVVIFFLENGHRVCDIDHDKKTVWEKEIQIMQWVCMIVLIFVQISSIFLLVYFVVVMQSWWSSPNSIVPGDGCPSSSQLSCSLHLPWYRGHHLSEVTTLLALRIIFFLLYEHVVCLSRHWD